MPPRVWTARRKWLGNLIPALFWLPLTVAGIWWMVANAAIVGLGLWLLIAATVLGWLAVNQWGFFENKKMRRELTRMLDSRGEKVGDAWFVGVATPRFSSMVDPHEEVGFLFVLPDRVKFVTDHRSIELYKEQIQRVRYRANVHTLIGLGRWVSLEGVADGKPIRLLIEPRERQTLFGNLRKSKVLRQKLARWVKGSSQ